MWIPIFVARYLEKPLQSLDNLDVTKLLRDLVLPKDEVLELKSTNATVDELKKVQLDLQNDLKIGSLIEHVQNEQYVNSKRGGGNGVTSHCNLSYRSLSEVGDRPTNL